MAMVLYPEVQKKAQEELDRVVGNRLPEFNDRLNLSYINAMVKESLRWQPVAPLGAYNKLTDPTALMVKFHSAVPHMATEAENTMGITSPKGLL